MMRVLIDTNIVIDVVLKRTDFFDSSFAVLKLLRERKYRGFVAATTLTNMYFIVRKAAGKAGAMPAVDKTLQWCEVAPVDYRVLDAALFANMKDFEDAVQTADCRGGIF